MSTTTRPDFVKDLPLHQQVAIANLEAIAAYAQHMLATADSIRRYNANLGPKEA